MLRRWLKPSASHLIGKTFAEAQYPAFTLGAAEASPISLANAYATLAARGKRPDHLEVCGQQGRQELRGPRPTVSR